MADHARLERDGDLGVLVIDNLPLNLFDADMVSGILRALDEAEGCRALLVWAEGRYFTGGVLTGEPLQVTHRIEALPFPRDVDRASPPTAGPPPANDGIEGWSEWPRSPKNPA